MAEVVPSFDSLTIVKQSKGWVAKYIVKSRSINYSVNLNNYETLSQFGLLILEDLYKYLDSLKSQVTLGIDKEGPKPEPITNSRDIILLQIYDESLTFRTIPAKGEGFKGGSLKNIKLPIRENLNQQIKIPYLTISENIKSNVDSLIIAIDQLASGATQ